MTVEVYDGSPGAGPVDEGVRAGAASPWCGAWHSERFGIDAVDGGGNRLRAVPAVRPARPDRASLLEPLLSVQA